MKTSITSNSRPLLRAFYAFLIIVALLWAMPRNARAQLYVGHEIPPKGGGSGGVVSEYNADTGELIKAKFIRRLDVPAGLAVFDKDNALFVSNEITEKIGKYDAATGFAINTSFITGLDLPIEIAVEGKTLFVGSGDIPGSVGKYNANTGKAINASFITLTGVVRIEGLVLMDPAPSSPTQSFLFMSESNPGDLGSVGKYNARTGATINANFITGLTQPSAIAVKSAK
jgi:hypothetical protein